jgi:predicted nucleic acid-binding protein
MRVALDSNIMIYAEGLTDDTRNLTAQKLIQNVPAGQLVVPSQAIIETMNWLIKRAKWSRHKAAASARSWLNDYAVQATDSNVLEAAFQLVSVHQLQVFDAIILAAAEESASTVLLSEDMQDGFRWRGVTVVNPFLDTPSPLIQNLLKA